ncbi:RDD family protein [Fervidibacillus albus]|uniref:RDD family protein n=1 Tax=Fervidibacillus albus TaxID=2980026 RepID=A0A9E8LWN5_9BACI|nr:RDD family protein [Fervidibacillus albus]WAA10149.1 RDD family protein [Fervidibacillus albus]
MDEKFETEKGFQLPKLNIRSDCYEETTYEVSDQYAYAGFWIRFWAFLVDLIVVWGLKQIFVTPFSYLFDWNMEQFLSPHTFLSAIVFYLYFVLMTKYFGQTLGKMIFGIKVIPLMEDNLSWKTVLFREWIGRYISTKVIILYVLVAFLPKKQGLHDYFSDTAVIHEHYRII